MRHHRGIYRGVYSALLDDSDYQRLTSNARLVLLSIRISKYAGLGSIFVYYRGVIAVQTGLTGRQVDAALDELAAHRWIEREGAVIWIRNGLRYDPNIHLANSKHRQAVEKMLHELPKLKIVLKYCDYYQLAYPFDTHSDTYTKVVPQEEEKEKEVKQEKEKEKDLTAVAVLSADADPGMARDWSKAPWPTPEALAHMYNTQTPDNCPAVETLSPRRRERARRLLRVFPAQDWWGEVFREYRLSRFLSGRVAPKPGHESFRPDFDWLLNTGKNGAENAVKVHDGAYRDG